MHVFKPIQNQKVMLQMAFSIASKIRKSVTKYRKWSHNSVWRPWADEGWGSFAGNQSDFAGTCQAPSQQAKNLGALNGVHRHVVAKATNTAKGGCSIAAAVDCQGT